MTTPQWATIGTVVQHKQEGPSSCFYIQAFENPGVILHAINGTETRRAADSDFATAYRPHRWILRAEPLSPPARIRVFYRNGHPHHVLNESITDTWEARARQPVPIWYITRGSRIVHKSTTNTFATIEAITRDGRVRLRESGAEMSFKDMEIQYNPAPPIEVGSRWVFWEEPSVEAVVTGLEGAQVTAMWNTADSHLTLPYEEFVRTMDPAPSEPMAVPRWAVQGATVVNAVTDEHRTITRIQTSGTRLMIMLDDTPVSLGQLALEWVPWAAPRRRRRDMQWNLSEPTQEGNSEIEDEDEDEDEDEEQGSTEEIIDYEVSDGGLEGTYWAWRSPPALLNVIADFGDDVSVEILPSHSNEIIPRKDLEANAARLRYRSRTSRPRDFRWGPGIFLDVSHGPVVIERVERRDVVLLSPESLSEEDGSVIINATALRAEPPDRLSEIPTKDHDEWEETSTQRKCIVDRIDARAGTVTIRWLFATLREVTLPTDQFLQRFRCLTPNGDKRFEKETDTGETTGWALLFKD